MTTIHIDGNNPNKCDVDRGPCACGAWHVMPAPEETRKRCTSSCRPACDVPPFCFEDECVAMPSRKDEPPKTLLKAAKDLRSAQRDYMILRDCRPEGDAIREYADLRVAQEAAELDRSIEAAERRQAAPVKLVREPSISEQHAMGVPSTGGEITP